VISLQDNKSAGTLQIPGTKSPNKLLIVDGTRAYVSNLYDNSITKFDPGTLTITKDRIPVGKNPAGLATANGKVYVCNSGWGQDSTVSVIDIAKDSIIKTIIVGLQPSEIGLDADGELIVKCDGLSDWYNPANSKPGSIAVINPSVDTVVARVQIPLMAYGNPGKMTISSKGYALICTKTNLSKVNTSTNVLSNAFSVGYEAYAAAIDDVTDLVYVADVKDYVQPGVITSYSTMNGSKQQTYTVGIIPGKIVIKR
jgi:YVTN family beta-propeller protein